MNARTYRGQARRLAREIRKRQPCPKCGRPTPGGMMLELRQGKMCSLCAVQMVRGRKFGEDERRA